MGEAIGSIPKEGRKEEERQKKINELYFFKI
jgi:hypothetical protein